MLRRPQTRRSSERRASPQRQDDPWHASGRRPDQHLLRRRGRDALGRCQDGIPLVYVPDHKTNNITVIDPATLKIVAVIPTGLSPQHVVPACDMGRLWVANNADGTDQGSLTPIDPTTVTGQLAEPRRTPSDPSNGLSASTTALMAGFTVSGSTSASVLCTTRGTL